MNDLLSLFTEWTPWSARKTIKAEFQNAPGVYLLGRFNEDVPVGKPQLSHHIVYIGETCDRVLSTRLSEFGRSAFKNKLAHSGGSAFHDKYKAEIIEEVPPTWLYLSVLGVSEGTKFRSDAYIRHVERALLWGYVDRHHTWPECNSK